MLSSPEEAEQFELVELSTSFSCRRKKTGEGLGVSYGVMPIVPGRNVLLGNARVCAAPLAGGVRRSAVLQEGRCRHP